MTRTRAPHGSMRRVGDGAAAVTTIELFFDLVYVYAVTRLSHFVLAHLSWHGMWQTAILLAMVWQIWIYTTWATNFVDPRRHEMRYMLLGLMFGSLLLASALDGAFGASEEPFTHDRGMFVAVCYVSMQVGRCLFMIWALRGEDLRSTFQRILAWSSTTGILMIVGAMVSAPEHVHVREALWATAIAIDTIAAAIGFWVPFLGRADTHDWTIAGSHFAERCQAFVLIALGESIALAGTQASALKFDATGWVSIVVVFAISAGLWWLYFDRAADDSAAVIASSDDPGRLARNAFHWIHPLMVGGIIVNAAGAEVILDDRAHHTETPLAWLILGGGALFLVGQALFKGVVWRTAPVTRLAGAAVLFVAGLFHEHASPLALGIVVLVVVAVIAVSDRYLHPESASEPTAELEIS